MTRAPLTISINGIEVNSYVCECGGRFWPEAAYLSHIKTHHSGADADRKVCTVCFVLKSRDEFVNKDHLSGAICRACRKRIERSKRARNTNTAGRGRKRQYPDVVLGIRGGFRTRHGGEK
jgi:hypothetical protein